VFRAKESHGCPVEATAAPTVDPGAQAAGGGAQLAGDETPTDPSSPSS